MSSQKTSSIGAVSSTLNPDLARQVERVERAAAAIPAAEIKVCRRNTTVMPINIRFGVASLSAAEVQAKVEALFPELDFRGLCSDLTDGGEALDYLASQVSCDPRGASSGRVQLAKGFELLATMSPQIALAVAQKIIPAARASAIPRSRGRSPVGVGSRIIESAMLLKEYLPQLAGRAFVDAAYLDDAVAVGTSLRNLGAAKLAKVGRKSQGPLAQRRDRVYTWLDGRYDLARRIGAFIFGDKVNKLVPPLTSCWVARRKAANDGTADTVPAQANALAVPTIPAVKAEVAPAASPTAPAKSDSAPLTLLPGAPAPVSDPAGTKNAA